jgi:prephenate dehydrogenase
VALVEAVIAGPGETPGSDWPAAAQLAVGGGASMTRLARGDAAMGAGIAVTNRAALARALHAYRDRIDEWLTDLEREGGPDEARLRARLDAARERLDNVP